MSSVKRRRLLRGCYRLLNYLYSQGTVYSIELLLSNYSMVDLTYLLSLILLTRSKSDLFLTFFDEIFFLLYCSKGESGDEVCSLTRPVGKKLEYSQLRDFSKYECFAGLHISAYTYVHIYRVGQRKLTWTFWD